MKKTILALAAVWTVFVTGCQSQVMPAGKYQVQDNSGAEDYVVTYEDLIFLNIRAPKRSTGLPYWNWAGNYSVAENGELKLDMDTATAKKWFFNYSFESRDGNIVVNDWSENRSFILKYNRPRRQFDSMSQE